MKRQKRFESEQAIIARIDARKRQVEELLAMSTNCDRQADECARKIAELSASPAIGAQLEINQLKVNLDRLRAESKKHNVTRHGIEENTLPTLKRTLAAFNTQPMPFLKDESVVLQS